MLSGVGMADLWDTAVRGIDLYRLADYVDCANFLSVPVTPAGDPDIYVTACHHSMMRAMNRGREFLGGIYWGRFLYNHLYEAPPARPLPPSLPAAQRDTMPTACAVWMTAAYSPGWSPVLMNP